VDVHLNKMHDRVVLRHEMPNYSPEGHVLESLLVWDAEGEEYAVLFRAVPEKEKAYSVMPYRLAWKGDWKSTTKWYIGYVDDLEEEIVHDRRRPAKLVEDHSFHSGGGIDGLCMWMTEKDGHRSNPCNRPASEHAQ
jgi:hypothetical protein